MLERQTEQLHAKSAMLDSLPLASAAAVLAEAQADAARAPIAAVDVIAAGARAMADSIRSGGALVYAAAGSSGLMAAADAMELGGTFDIPSSQIRIAMAGGIPTTPDMANASEDDTDSFAALGNMTPSDTVITVTASGSTPFTFEAARRAKAADATVIGIANNAGADLFDLADHKICLETPAEVLAGSTRMGAGTAQKIALNMLSTLMAVELGHIYQGQMVNVRPENAKLVDRAKGIIARASGVDPSAAATAFDAANGQVKPAILLAAGAKTLNDAKEMLAESEGHLGPALGRLNNTDTKNQ